MSNISILQKCSFSCSVFGLLQSGGSTLSEKQIGATSAQLLSQWNPPVEPHGQISCTDIRNTTWSSKSQMQTLSVPRPGNGLPNCLGQEFISKFICAGGQHTVCSGIQSLHSLEASTFFHILAMFVPEIYRNIRWLVSQSFKCFPKWPKAMQLCIHGRDKNHQEGCNWWSARCLPKHAMTATVYKEPQRARKSGSLVEEHPKFRCVYGAANTAKVWYFIHNSMTQVWCDWFAMDSSSSRT